MLLTIPATLCLSAALGAIETLPCGGPGPDAGVEAARGGTGEGERRHSIAFVNHSLSHGTLGDRFLSLNEAIQLHNRTLTFAQLSPGEQAQLSGQQDIAWIDLDATQTPVLFMERDLDPIFDPPNTSHGCDIRGFGGRPVIDFQGRTNGFVTSAGTSAFTNLEIRNAAIGIDAVQTDAPGGIELRNVRFTGQTVASLRIRMTSAGHIGRMVMDDCMFDGVPTGILIEEPGAARSTQVLVSDVTMTGVQTGFHVRLGPGGGAGYLLERFDIEASGAALLFERPAGADRRFQLEAINVRAVGNPALRVDGAAGAGATNLLLEMLDLESASGAAFSVGPLGSAMQGMIQNSRMTGDVAIGVGGSFALAIDNLLHQGGQFSIGASDGPLTVDRAVFAGSTVVTTGAVPVPIRHSCFRGGMAGGTVSAPLQVEDSFVGATMGGSINVVRPLLAPQLGSFAVAPARPALGGTLTITADLPPGLLGICALGGTAELPQPPIYFEPLQALTLGTLFLGQQSVSLTIPTTPSFVDSDWVAHLLVLPNPGVPAPAWFLPPAQRFVLR